MAPAGSRLFSYATRESRLASCKIVSYCAWHISVFSSRAGSRCDDIADYLANGSECGARRAAAPRGGKQVLSRVSAVRRWRRQRLMSRPAPAAPVRLLPWASPNIRSDADVREGANSVLSHGTARVTAVGRLPSISMSAVILCSRAGDWGRRCCAIRRWDNRSAIHGSFHRSQ